MPRGPKILIVKLSAIGDVVHTLPALNALRQHYPEAHITWLVEEAAADLIMGHESLDRVLVSRRKHWEKELRKGKVTSVLRQAVAFIHKLRDTHYDIILDFQAALKGAAMIGLARGDRKIGYGPGMAHQEHSYRFLNERVPMVDVDTHALKRSLLLLEAIGIHSPTIAYHLPITIQSRHNVAEMMQSSPSTLKQVPIAINPMALWETKLWVPDRFAKLADRLISEHQARIYFTGGSADRLMIDGIVRKMHHGAVNLAGATSLMELAALYQEMAMVITTDTGPMHIAAAVDTPVIALFGPTSEHRTGPYGERHHVVSTNLACRPCFKRTCAQFHCMPSITVEDIVKHAQLLL